MTFEELYSRYYPAVLSYIEKRIQNYSDAEDLTMDVFVSVHKNFDKYDSRKANYATWIFVIANNRLKNYYRDKKVFCEMDESIASDDDFAGQIIASEYIAEMRQALFEALRSLNELQRKIVIYRYFYDKNATQISEMIGIPSGSVRVQLSRGLGKMKKYLLQHDVEWEED